MFTCLFQPKSPTPLLSASHHCQGPPFLGRVISGTEPGSGQQLAARASTSVGPGLQSGEFSIALPAIGRRAVVREASMASRAVESWMRDVGVAVLFGPLREDV